MNSQSAINAALKTKLNAPPQAQTPKHRFEPGEKPRSVVSSPNSLSPNLASEVSFSPVTTIAAGVSQTYVRPVKNTHQRPVSPAALNPNGQVSIRGERVIELANNLHQQIRAKVNQKASGTKGPTLPTTEAGTVPTVKPRPILPSIPTLTPEQTKVRNNELKQQLEQINKQLFEQIQQKISQEISRQTGQQPIQSSTAAKPLAFKQPKLIAPEKLLTNKPEPASNQTKAPTSQFVPAVSQQTQIDTSLTTKQTVVAGPEPATLTPLEPKNVGTETKKIPGQDSITAHIDNLEKEIEQLTREIGHIDQTITALDKENKEQDLLNLQDRLNRDEKMVQAVSDWKYTLTNLVNSHTIALKYLKQKTDWLTDKIDSSESHHAKHEKNHRKPREISFKLERLEQPKKEVRPEQVGSVSAEVKPINFLNPAPTTNVAQTKNSPLVGTLGLAASNAPTESEKPNLVGSLNLVSKPETTAEVKPIVGTVNLVSAKAEVASPTVPPLGKVTLVQEQAPTEIRLNVPDQTASNNTTVIESTLTQKPQIQGTMPKEEFKPEELRAAVEKTLAAKKSELPPTVVEKEVLPEKIVSEKIESMVKEALQKQQPETPSVGNPQTQLGATEVDRLVSEALKKQLPHQSLQIEPVTDLQTTSNKTPTVTVPANISLGEPKVLPGNPEAQINIQAIPVETSAKPRENLPTIATGASLSLQSDIERQILEAAAKEEAVREAVQKAKEDKENQAKKEREKADSTEEVKVSQTDQNKNFSPDGLKNDITKIKSSLTTTDNKSLEGLSKDERSQMLQKLTSLEKQNEVSRQLDDIKAASERRKVNSELQQILQKLGEKGPEVSNPTSQPATTLPSANQQVETLKAAEKKQRSPEEKAKIIAEIKALEREREARKLEERSRPVVKAQPAYGKMLPNTPTIPNVINGIVKSNTGLLMDTVVIIVKDQNGDPVRAFKTNKIGQFAVSTPLPNGVYTLELEKVGADFDIIEVEVNGGILPPIEIKAR